MSHQQLEVPAECGLTLEDNALEKSVSKTMSIYCKSQQTEEVHTPIELLLLVSFYKLRSNLGMGLKFPRIDIESLSKSCLGAVYYLPRLTIIEITLCPFNNNFS